MPSSYSRLMRAGHQPIAQSQMPKRVRLQERIGRGPRHAHANSARATSALPFRIIPPRGPAGGHAAATIAPRAANDQTRIWVQAAVATPCVNSSRSRTRRRRLDAVDVGPSRSATRVARRLALRADRGRGFGRRRASRRCRRTLAVDQGLNRTTRPLGEGGEGRPARRAHSLAMPRRPLSRRPRPRISPLPAGW